MRVSGGCGGGRGGGVEAGEPRMDESCSRGHIRIVITWGRETAVCGGVCGVWWCVVVCGGVWWCVVMCGGVWWWQVCEWRVASTGLEQHAARAGSVGASASKSCTRYGESPASKRRQMAPMRAWTRTAPRSRKNTSVCTGGGAVGASSVPGRSARRAVHRAARRRGGAGTLGRSEPAEGRRSRARRGSSPRSHADVRSRLAWLGRRRRRVMDASWRAHAPEGSELAHGRLLAGSCSWRAHGGSELAHGRPRDGGRRTPASDRRPPRATLVRWHAVRDAHARRAVRTC